MATTTALSTTSAQDVLLRKGNEQKGFDPRKLSINSIRVVLIGAALAFGLYKVLPYLNTIVWGLVELAEGALALGIVSFIIWFLWKNIGDISEFLSKTLLFWLIDHDPWVFQYKQIDNAEEDLEKMIHEKDKIHGVWVENTRSVQDAQNLLDEALAAEEIVREELRRTDLTPEGRLLKEQALRDQIAEQVRQQNFIEQVSPLSGDMKNIIDIVNQGSVLLRGKIKNARADLKTLKAAYDTTKAGAEALTRMRSAMMGNLELNNKAELSRMRVLKDITISIGTIRSGTETIMELTSAQNLQDRARLEVAKKKLQALGLDAGSITGTQFTAAIPVSKTFANIATNSDTRYNIPD